MTTLRLLALICLLSSAATAEVARVLIVVGPSKHPPGTHEVQAGAMVMKHCLEHMTNVPGVAADVVIGWPKDKAIRDAASTIVFIGDTFPANRLPDVQQNLSDLDQMMKRGCGMVCIHYATGLLGEDVKPDGDHPLLRWIGGYFANRSCPHHESFAKIFQAATITPAAKEHPINRGWKEFTFHDEPYYNNYFGPNGNQPAANVTILATSMLPTESPKPEPVAWCVERADTGRGFGIVMPHFYRNWRNEDLRRNILNGIIWTAKVAVPNEGVLTPMPNLAAFGATSLEPLPPKPKTNASVKPQWLIPDQIIYTDDFSKPRPVATSKQQSNEPWIVNQGTRWEMVDGVLRGRASSPDYQAKHETHKGVHPRVVLQTTPEKYVLQLSLRIVDGIPFEAGKRRSVAPFIEIGHHVCRVTWDVNGATLLADGDTTQLANDKDFKLVPGKWETVLIERRDDEVLVQFANGPTFHGQHASYVTDPHAVMLGGLEAGTMEIDNVTLWSVEEGTQPSWNAFLAKRPQQQNLVLRPKTPGRLAAEKKAAEAKASPK